MKNFKKWLMKKLNYKWEYDFNDDFKKVKTFVITALVGILGLMMGKLINNIYITIFGMDISALSIFYLVGLLCVNKEFSDTWKGSETMEVKKSQKLSEDWSKKHPILDACQDFYYDYNRKLEIPGETYRAIKWFIQRGKRGYSDCDVWGFDYYLSEVIIQGLMDLKKQAHGCPCGMVGTQSIELEDEPSENMIEWKRILETIIWTFKASRKIQDRKWIPVFDERRRSKFETYVKELKKPDKNPLFKGVKLEYYLMTKRDMERYEEGWKNFKKYYFDLWD